MTDSIPKSNGHRWLRKAIPGGIAVLLNLSQRPPALTVVSAASFAPGWRRERAPQKTLVVSLRSTLKDLHTGNSLQDAER